ncbi:relaxase/mobilization nuclease domain-containing protein [Glacieibacterium frigidum]|uniref:MobA/VirD2-like nuclease domain-containing protein n=1 Tax=Glacieibacterium frigidum TaxID=2593303 RepID=A0A552UHN3_9SPHN|nr:relaxase/mobilization nuclease domain-containing protein [Glacieibacterium frigidum]TRW17735.1 hypothetical protein FMM06_06255 [Glacieibacterium frigidum]
MIGEHTRGSDFDGLFDYLTEKRDHTVIELSGVSSVEHAGAEMQATSRMAPQISQPVLQISLSAAIEDGDKMDQARWRELFGLIKAELLMTSHQAVLVEHHDKAYHHAHGALCIIDPRPVALPRTGTR